MGYTDLVLGFSGRIRRLSKWLCIFGQLPLFLMLAITALDVIGAKLFSLPVPGGPEVVASLQVLAIASAAGYLQMRGGHTRIDFFVDKLPSGLKAGVAVFIQFLVLILFAALCRECFLLGDSLKEAGEITSTAHIPLYPLAYFMSFCFLVVSLAALADLLMETARRGQS
ncbi:MAG: TRAP transporter small permease [Desulfarculaceae bacterium]|jgi:TRAP-type C4-dicarboxylate transport system permease small subunit